MTQSINITMLLQNYVEIVNIVRIVSQSCVKEMNMELDLIKVQRINYSACQDLTKRVYNYIDRYIQG
jgi:MoaA/NifB/PqqE/SkfB family radical SAM enzyme